MPVSARVAARTPVDSEVTPVTARATSICLAVNRFREDARVIRQAAQCRISATRLHSARDRPNGMASTSTPMMILFEASGAGFVLYSAWPGTSLASI